jgi:uncharacterized membrane protein YjgN (DUF898 family)
MSESWSSTPGRVLVKYTGERWQFAWMLLRGYLLTAITLGVYRFWLTTAKRRYYWSNTVIDGDPLEYTGNALQLLVGFLFALAFFLPIYLTSFIVSTQVGTVILIGYGVLFALLWFFIGYAQYRGRDFRLSRTLWRGIRFDQRGSAMAYAVRRFLWSLLTIVTAGLAYPFMSADLWRYRYTHTWFGDRQVTFTGTWRTVAGPFYRAWFGVAAIAAVTVGLAASGLSYLFSLGPLFTLVVAALAFCYWRAREATRMFSSIQLGQTRVDVSVRARSLFGQYAAYGVLAVITLAVVSGVGIGLAQGLLNAGTADMRSLLTGGGWTGAVLVVGGYLLGFGTLSLLAETILDFGYWKAVAGSARLLEPEHLSSVRAGAEDTSVVGEGLADALNVGSF